MLQSYYKKRVINFAVFVASLMALAGGPVLMSTLSARALNQSTNFVVTIPDVPTLQITLYDDQGNEMDSTDITSMNVTATMATAGFNTKGMSVMVGTSSTAGYHLNMSVANGGQLVSGANSIPSLASETDAENNPFTCSVATADICNFTENSWGYWMTGFGTNVYKPIPAAETELVNYTTGATDGETTHFSFGVRANAKQPAGNYTTTINYIATANPEGIFDIENVQTMQDFAMLSAEEYTAVLASMDPAETYTLADSRDDNSYTIQKLADGNVWMLDNLQLDIAANKANITSTNTNANDTALGYLKNGSGSSPYTTDAAVNTSASAWSGDVRYTKAMYNTEYADYDASYGNGTYKSGYYYNYCAASAGSYCYDSSSGTGNASQDICPAGWQMPAGDSSTYSYQKLYEAYGSDYAAFKNALHVGLSGVFDGGILSQGSYGYFWASTYNSSSSMRNLYVIASSVSPQYGYSRFIGFSVRCVLKSAAEHELESGMTMQSFASMSSEDKTTFLAGMPTNVTYQMTDVRDSNTYNVAKLVDGNLWLMDNLSLDLVNVPLTDLQGNTNASNDTLAKLKNGGGSSPYTTAAVVETSSFGTSGDAYTAAKINSLYGSYNKDSEWLYDGTNKGKQGIYYNYCAASAGSYCYADDTLSSDPDTTTLIDAKEDICPAGWRMPTGGGNGEYQNLCTTAWGSACSQGMDMSYSNAKSIQSVLHAPLSGYFSGTSAYNQGSLGYFWSSTYYNGNYMYHLRASSSKSWAQGSSYRNDGLSVRCVLKSSS